MVQVLVRVRETGRLGATRLDPVNSLINSVKPESTWVNKYKSVNSTINFNQLRVLFRFNFGAVGSRFSSSYGLRSQFRFGQQKSAAVNGSGQPVRCGFRSNPVNANLGEPLEIRVLSGVRILKDLAYFLPLCNEDTSPVTPALIISGCDTLPDFRFSFFEF